MTTSTILPDLGVFEPVDTVVLHTHNGTILGDAFVIYDNESLCRRRHAGESKTLEKFAVEQKEIQLKRTQSASGSSKRPMAAGG